MTTTHTSQTIKCTHYEFHFEKVFCNSKYFPLFEAHTKKELNKENVDFIVAVDAFEKLIAGGANFTTAKEKATALFETFIKEQAAKEINVSNLVREVTVAKYTKIQQLQDEREALSEYKELFSESYVSVLRNLKEDVFPRFKRSKQWIDCVEKLNSEQVKEIGTHKSELYGVSLSLEDLARFEFDEKDVQFALMLMQDYYHWKELAVKKNDYQFYTSSRSFMTPEVTSKMGYFTTYKTIAMFDCSAKDLLLLSYSKEHLPCFYPHCKIAIVDDVDLSEQKKPSCTVFCIHTSKLPSIMTKRFIIQSLLCYYDAKSRTYIVISKDCDHPKIAVPKKRVRAQSISVQVFQDIPSEGRCRRINVVLANVQGVLKQTKKPNMSSILKAVFSSNLKDELTKSRKVVAAWKQKREAPTPMWDVLALAKRNEGLFDGYGLRQ